MRVVDLGLQLPDGEADRPVEPLLEGSHSTWSLLTIEPGSTWEAPPTDLEERAILVLDGHATFAADGVRTTLGPGHLAMTEAGAQLLIRGDGKTTLTALMCVSPRPMEEV